MPRDRKTYSLNVFDIKSIAQTVHISWYLLGIFLVDSKWSELAPRRIDFDESVPDLECLLVIPGMDDRPCATAANIVDDGRLDGVYEVIVVSKLFGDIDTDHVVTISLRKYATLSYQVNTGQLGVVFSLEFIVDPVSQPAGLP